MNNWFSKTAKALLLGVGSIILFSFFNNVPSSNTRFHFPYKNAGLTERAAAAHLLNRFSYGATAGQVDEVVNMGLEKWFEQQLNGGLNDDSLNLKLSGYNALKLSDSGIVATFPKGFQILKMAIADSLISKDSVNKADKKEYKLLLAAYMAKKGLKPEQELFRQFINQKVLRAAYSNNQLHEVLTDFWFNHFNVSITKNDCAQFIPNYERDIIRPNVTGKFSNLLLATAKSPAMLLYLDNFTSAGLNNNADVPGNEGFKRIIAERLKLLKDTSSKQATLLKKLETARKNQGLNENYAREVMELHTLGVDGGYTQHDVTEAARILTGWTIYPMSYEGYGGAIRKLIDKVGEDKLAQKGFVHDGNFLFAMNRHDNNEKTVLGVHFPANGGYTEGVQLLEMLAHSPSTANFICKKLAVRFVSDDPPQSIIDKMVKTFKSKDGDIKEVLITMASAPEFWNASAIRGKTKSPFELAISAIRALHADIQQPYQVFMWVDKMGQKFYYYQAPTGFPDRGQYWINTGSLLSRMNFGLAIASQKIPGTKMDLLALNNHHEPESTTAALVTYGKYMLPERNLDETVKRLTPLMNDPGIVKKVDAAAGKSPVVNNNNSSNNMSTDVMTDEMKKTKPEKILAKNTLPDNNSMLSQVVGILIGSPEFQRR